VIRLPRQQVDQRIDTVRGAFQRLGDVIVARQSDANPQTIEITIDHPGWGVSTEAQLHFVEIWVRKDESWHLVKYAYDLFLHPGPGRFGFHWHDGTYHTHCVDPTSPARDHHFAGEPIDIFAAFDRFTALLTSGLPLSCTGLRAAGPRQK
jgi:hypothetical protein